MTVGIGRTNIILHCLSLPRKRIVHMAVQHLMKLKDIVLRDGDGVIALMDDAQHIAVSGYQLLSLFRCVEDIAR